MAKHTKLKTLLEGYAWERSESSFGKPLATLAEIQAAYQAKQIKENGFLPIEGQPGHNVPLKIGKLYQVLDPGMNDWNNDYEYVGQAAQGSSCCDDRDHLFKAAAAPGTYIFVNIPDSDLKQNVKVQS
jgi:hypothetical protein